MKKFLIATTILVSTAGFAAAEVKINGTAGMGLKYGSEGDGDVTTSEDAKTRVFSKVNLEFVGSGESDGGLAFGFFTNLLVENNGGAYSNDDTQVYISGAFGKLSMGAVSEADEVAGLSDIGWDGLEVDDIAESIVGDDLDDLTGVSLGHNVNYTYEANGFKVSISGLLAEDPDNLVFPTSATSEKATESYAVGVKYSFSDYYVGLGYASHDSAYIADSKIGDLVGGIAGRFDSEVVSIYGGATFGDIGVKALYAQGDHTATPNGAAAVGIDSESFGISGSYKMDALTLTAAYAKAEFEALGLKAEEEAYGIGASYDLGGGASVSGGIASVKSGDEGYGTFLAPVRETRADFGLTLKF
ncbi:MAG: porin [Rhodobacteraceae bacterium]|nr:porin [Paracoccaceae bacterium]